MPHMSPIMWSSTLMTSVGFILVMLSILYFNFFLENPSEESLSLTLGEQNWEW